MTRHPMQAIDIDPDGVARFRGNRIVRFLVDWCAGQNGVAGYPVLDTPGGAAPDLNTLALMPFPQADREQLAQLIGYSVSGAGDLPYMDPRTIADADATIAALVAKSGGKQDVMVDPPRMDGRGIVYGVLIGSACWLLIAALIWAAAYLLREVL